MARRTLSPLTIERTERREYDPASRKDVSRKTYRWRRFADCAD
jgi:hypothetical protein